MLKNPSTIEQELDELRDQMWQEAGQDSDRWFQLVRERSKEVSRQSQESFEDYSNSEELKASFNRAIADGQAGRASDKL